MVAASGGLILGWGVRCWQVGRWVGDGGCGDYRFVGLGLLWVGSTGGDCGFVFVCDFGGWGLGGGGGGYDCGWWWL